MQPSPSHRRQLGTLAATILASSMTFLDGTVVNVALPALQADLRASIVDLQWVVEAYALFLGALLLVGGSLGDQFGRKKIFILGVVFFTLSSVVCAAAPTSGVVIAGRALQGVGAALLVPGSLAIISSTFGDADRGRAIGTWSAFSAGTTAIGPVVGGWLIQHVSWRAAFYINVPLAVAVLLLSHRYMDESRDATRDQRIDWPGAGLVTAGLGAFVFALIELPSHSIGQAHVLVPLFGGLAALVGFVVVEARTPHAMMPLSLFRSVRFTATNLLTLLLYGALSLSMFLLPLNLIEVQGYSAVAAGASLLPLAIVISIGSRWAGGLSARIGPRWLLTTGPAVVGVGLMLLARAGIGGSYWTTFFPGVAVLGAGMAVTVAPLTSTVMSSLDSRHAGVASGVNNAVSRVGGLLAIAVFGVVLSGAFHNHAGAQLAALPISAPARSAVNGQLDKLAGADLRAVPTLSAEQRVQVRAAIDGSFVSAFGVVMICAALLAFASAVVGLFCE
jgi:EmrB/QacA subfamily drug resistance transporter